MDFPVMDAQSAGSSWPQGRPRRVGWIGRATTGVLRAAAFAAILHFLAHCSPAPPLRIRDAAGGGLVVEVGRPQAFDEIAESIYGDPEFGPFVASVADLPYEDGAPAGALLVLPSRAEVREREEALREAEARFRKGSDSVASGAFREAATEFRAALILAPERSDIRYNLGLALMRAGELEEATQVLEEAAALRPRDAEARYAFGSVLRQRRAHRRALGEFEAALSLDRNHAKAAFAHARTLEDLGETDAARRAWRAYLRDFPEGEWADRARARLQELDRP
jgi:tetratricopeptide (TPR) repeat protein